MFPQVKRPGSIQEIVTALQALLEFFGPYKTPEPWRKLTPLNGWGLDPAVGLYQDPMPLGYRKDPLGRVYLRGVASAAAPTSPVVATLIAGYRPTHAVYFENVYVLANGNVVSGLPNGAILNDVSFDTRE